MAPLAEGEVQEMHLDEQRGIYAPKPPLLWREGGLAASCVPVTVCPRELPAQCQVSIDEGAVKPDLSDYKSWLMKI